MTRKSTPIVFAAIALAICATPLVAASTRKPAVATPPTARTAAVATVPPAEVIRTRIAGLRDMGAAFKNVMDGLRGGEPQLVMIRQSARYIKNESPAIYRWFPAGSGPAPGLKTSAKPEIWSKPADFRAAQDGLVRAADALQIAAISGNADAIRAAARGLGGACKTCHDQFRVPPAR